MLYKVVPCLLFTLTHQNSRQVTRLVKASCVVDCRNIVQTDPYQQQMTCPRIPPERLAQVTLTACATLPFLSVRVHWTDSNDTVLSLTDSDTHTHRTRTWWRQGRLWSKSKTARTMTTRFHTVNTINWSWGLALKLTLCFVHGTVCRLISLIKSSKSKRRDHFITGSSSTQVTCCLIYKLLSGHEEEDLICARSSWALLDLQSPPGNCLRCSYTHSRFGGVVARNWGNLGEAIGPSLSFTKAMSPKCAPRVFKLACCQKSNLQTYIQKGRRKANCGQAMSILAFISAK